MRSIICKSCWLGLLLAGLSACEAGTASMHDYQIVINGSITPAPVEFAGSYTCSSSATEELTRDIVGAGSMTMSFQCSRLNLVRIQRIMGVGMVSLAVYKNGNVIFDSPPTESSAPLVYVNRE